MQFTSEACGKTILTGEHAVVYGYPALLLPLKICAKCTIRDIKKDASNNGNVEISALGERTKFSWQEIDGYCSIKRGTFLQNNKLGLVLISLKTAFEFFKVKQRPSFRLSIESLIPIGGFGSSTAVSAAVIRCVAKMLRKSISPRNLWKLLVKVETKNGVKVSGADQYVVSYESPVKYQKNFRVQKVKFHSKILKKFLVINSGMPVCTTKESVDFVAREKKLMPGKINMIFRRISYEGKKMLGYLKNDDTVGFFRTIKNSGELLISLGVVSADSVNLIRKIEKLGGYLKLTGAGTIGKGGSGGILCFGYNYKKIESFLLKNNVEYLSMSL